MKKINRKTWLLLGIAAAVVVACIGGKLLFDSRYLVLNGETYDLRATEVDLHGRRIEDVESLLRFEHPEKLDIRGCGISLPEHEWLKKQLPDCDIRWEIEFQGKIYSPETQVLTVDHLSDGDLVTLDFFPALTTVHADRCEDYEALTELARRHPGCAVNYSVLLGGTDWALDARNLSLEDETADHVRKCLPYLPLTETVEFTGALPPMKDISALEQEFPDLTFSWQVTLEDDVVAGDAELVDLSQAADTGDFVAAMPYLPNLKAVNLRGSQLPEEQLRSLVVSYPDLSFRWDVPIGESLVDSDAREAEITGALESPEEIRAAMPFLGGLEKLVVLDSGLSNEDLDALNQEFPDTRIVWNMDIGGVELRTDSLYYAPNKYKGSRVSDEICAPLRYCTDMICVDVGHGFLRSCEWIASMPKLKYLILADTSITDITPVGNLKELVFLELFQSPVKDYSPLLGCTALEDLNLCYSYGDPEPIRQMTWLKHLWWDGIWFPESQLRDSLPDTQVECNSHSSTGKGWRELQNYYDMRDCIGMYYMEG